MEEEEIKDEEAKATPEDAVEDEGADEEVES